MAKAKLGNGQRFKAVAKAIEPNEDLGMVKAKAIAATIGRKKFGATKMSDLAAAGKKRKPKLGM